MAPHLMQSELAIRPQGGRRCFFRLPTRLDDSSLVPFSSDPRTFHLPNAGGIRYRCVPSTKRRLGFRSAVFGNGGLSRFRFETLGRIWAYAP